MKIGNGEVYSWGNGEYGQLGHGDCSSQKLPKLIDFFIEHKKNAKSISCGHKFSIVLSDDGLVFSFGFGKHGELGHGDNQSYSTPTNILSIRDEIFIAISSGSSHTLLLSQSQGPSHPSFLHNHISDHHHHHS